MTRTLPWLGALLAAAAVGAAQPQDAGPLTPTQLGEILEKLGLEPKAVSKTKDWYQVVIDREGLKFFYNIRLHDNRKQLLIYTSLAEIPDNAPPAALRRLLEENDRLGRPNFVYNKTDKNIYLLTPMENAGITSARLRKEIDQFDSGARKTRPLWQGDNFVKLWGVPEDVGQEALQALRGNWKIEERWVGGKRTLGSDLKKMDARVRIADGKVRWTFKSSGKDATDEQTMTVDPRRTPKALDLISKDGRVQAAIYELTDDTLTIAAGSGLGLPRPATLDEGKKGIKLVLKRTGGQP
jgi:uncharacterized protein (TIGR03067 family)